MRRYIKLPIASAIRKSFPEAPFEFSDEQIEKLKTYSDVLLTVVSTAAVAAMVVLAPNALQALDIFRKRKGRKKLPHKEKQRKIIRSFYYLKEKEWIDFKRKGDDYEVVVTENGKKKIRTLNLETIYVSKLPDWDGKFWQVAADIPTEDYRSGADALRKKLKEMRFYPLQRTLWFFPYDPRMEIEFITRHYGVFNFTTVMKIEELDLADERLLRGYFRKEGLI